jgi:hypothetical protein
MQLRFLLQDFRKRAPMPDRLIEYAKRADILGGFEALERAGVVTNHTSWAFAPYQRCHEAIEATVAPLNKRTQPDPCGS